MKNEKSIESLENEIAQLKQELAFQRNQLELNSKLSALGEMAASIGHEINNPLAIIASRAGGIIDLSKSPQMNTLHAQQIRESATSIENTVMRISKIVKTLKSFTRGMISEDYEMASVHDLITEALDLSKVRLQKNEILCEYHPYASDLKIHCSPSQICQVLINILNNSCDALEHLENKWIRIEIEKNISEGNSQFLVMSITDSGEKPQEEVLTKMMDPFFTTKSAGRGTGLGLSISKKIIDQHQGSLEIDPTCKNTKIIIKIPLS